MSDSKKAETYECSDWIWFVFSVYFYIFPARISVIHDETESFTFHRSRVCLSLWLWLWIASDIFVILLILFQPPAVTRLPPAILGTKNKSSSKASHLLLVLTCCSVERGFAFWNTKRLAISSPSLKWHFCMRAESCKRCRFVLPCLESPALWKHPSRAQCNLSPYRSKQIWKWPWAYFTSSSHFTNWAAEICLCIQGVYVCAFLFSYWILSRCFVLLRNIKCDHALFTNKHFNSMHIGNLVSRSVAVIFLSVCVGVCVHTAVCV